MSDRISFSCECGTKLKALPEQAGKDFPCPKCRKIVAVPIASRIPSVLPQVQFTDSVVAKCTGDEDDQESSTVRRANGGSVQTHLGGGIRLNGNSTLSREWITITDPSFPIELIGDVGLEISHRFATGLEPGGFSYDSIYAVRSTEFIQAFELRLLTFDVWGNHVKTLSATQIQDIPAGQTFEFASRWDLFSENEACEFYSSISFISQARTQSRRVLQADIRDVIIEAKRMSRKFTEESLEPCRPGSR